MKKNYLTVLVGFFLLPTYLISQNVSLSGLISRHNGEPVSNVQASCINSSTSDADGFYEIIDIPLNTTCQLILTGTYEKFDDLTILDALIVRQHVLAQNILNTFQIIAADVNNSSTVTALDILKLTRLAIKKDDGVPPNWLFLSSTNPLMTSFEIVVNDSLNNVNFTTIKRGDPAISSDHMPAPPEASTPIFTIDKDEFEVGETVKVEVFAENLTNIGGIQSTFSWDPTLLEFESINGFQDINIEINSDSIDQGRLAIITAALVDLNINSGLTLFTLEFTAIDNAPNSDNYVKMTDDMIPRQVVWLNPVNNELFIVDAEYIGSEVETVSVNILAEEIENFNVFPNPVGETLNVNVLLKENNVFDIEIVNVLGQVVFFQKYETKQLVEEIDVSHLVEGPYFLTLKNGNGILTKKLSLTK